MTKKRPIGIGIAGWGFMGRTHAYAALNIPLFYEGLPFRPVLRAVCSGHVENAKMAQEELGFARACDSFEELLALPGVDVVSICTPNALHEQMALQAFAAGKAVYLDKPVSVDGPSAARVAAAGAGRMVQVAFHNRFFPCALRAKQLVEEGRLGKLLNFRIQYLHSGSVDEERPVNWKSDRQICGGGVLLDLGSHALDMLVHLAGPVESLCCRNQTLYASRPRKGGGRIETLGEDASYLLLRLQNGAQGLVEVSKVATGASDGFTVELCGDKGALRFNLMDPNWLYFYDNTRPGGLYGGERGWQRLETIQDYPAPGGAFLPPKNAIGWARAHMHCYYSFLDCYFRGARPSPSLEEGAYVQRLLDLCYLSERRGGFVAAEE